MPKKIVFVIAQKDFRDEELLTTQRVLASRGIETKIASENLGKAYGRLGAVVDVDLKIDNIKTADFNGIVFVGGRGMAQYLEDIRLLELARQFYRAELIVAAICIAPSILANAGILMGKTATAIPSQEENLKNRGADYTGMQVEADGKIITGKDPSAAEEFGDKIYWILGE